MTHISDIVRIMSEGLLTEAARPGTVVFKRGTVINADHITLVKQGYRAIRRGTIAPFLLMGIDPLFVPMGTVWLGAHPQRNFVLDALQNCGHHEYWGARAVPAPEVKGAVTNAADDWEDTFSNQRIMEVGRFFRKVLTANLRNIQSIDGMTPQEWVAQSQGGGTRRPPQQ